MPLGQTPFPQSKLSEDIGRRFGTCLQRKPHGGVQPSAPRTDHQSFSSGRSPGCPCKLFFNLAYIPPMDSEILIFGSGFIWSYYGKNLTLRTSPVNSAMFLGGSGKSRGICSSSATDFRIFSRISNFKVMVRISYIIS